MYNKKKRGILATAGALVTAAALALSGAAAANAEMPTTSDLVITKLEQGVATPPGEEANGLVQDITDFTPINGVTFDAYKIDVPGGFAAGTNEWQLAVGDVTLAQAQAQVNVVPAPQADRTGETAGAGTITWTDLAQGLYLIRESATPDGIVPAGDFLVALPLTDPMTLDENGGYQAGLTKWLDTVYVYPKNAKVDGTKDVENATDYSVGDAVTWTIDTAIPAVRDHGNGSFVATDRFDIFDTLTNAQLTLVDGATSVEVTAPADLTVGTGSFDDAATADYFVVLDTTTVATETTVQVKFTAQGRQKLADALNVNSAARVEVTLETTIESVGEIQNKATVFPGGDSKFDIDPATVKYGNYLLRKDSSNDAITDLSGAEFRVYLTDTAAKEALDEEYSDTQPNGYLTTKENSLGLWTTDELGQVSVGGLRYSAWADGAAITDPEAELTYWLVETKALEGHQLLAAPHPFKVDENSGAVATQTDQIVNQENTNGFVLPLTGGTGTLFLTILGVGILAVVLVVARRRNTNATTE